MVKFNPPIMSLSPIVMKHIRAKTGMSANRLGRTIIKRPINRVNASPVVVMNVALSVANEFMGR
jgi:hypothetical protein